MDISYDETKHDATMHKRGLSFELVRDLDWSTALIAEDVRNDYGERRFQALGMIDGRLYMVVFTPRSVPHIISLRKANSREVRKYEKAKSQDG